MCLSNGKDDEGYVRHDVFGMFVALRTFGNIVLDSSDASDGDRVDDDDPELATVQGLLEPTSDKKVEDKMRRWRLLSESEALDLEYDGAV